MAIRKVKYSKSLYSNFDFGRLALNLSHTEPKKPHLFLERDKAHIVSALPFKSGNTYFFIDVDFIEMIIPKREKFYNDNYPEIITGVIAYENTIIPCISPSKLCCSPHSDEGNCFIVASNDNFRFALECDFVRFPVKCRLNQKQDDLLLHKTKYNNKDYYFLNVEILLDLLKELEIE